MGGKPPESGVVKWYLLCAAAVQGWLVPWCLAIRPLIFLLLQFLSSIFFELTRTLWHFVTKNSSYWRIASVALAAATVWKVCKLNVMSRSLPSELNHTPLVSGAGNGWKIECCHRQCTVATLLILDKIKAKLTILKVWRKCKQQYFNASNIKWVRKLYDALIVIPLKEIGFPSPFNSFFYKDLQNAADFCHKNFRSKYLHQPGLT